MKDHVGIENLHHLQNSLTAPELILAVEMAAGKLQMSVGNFIMMSLRDRANAVLIRDPTDIVASRNMVCAMADQSDNAECEPQLDFGHKAIDLPHDRQAIAEGLRHLTSACVAEQAHRSRLLH